jgi:predicted RNase H-like nuclease (RuvC/YqgF family)
MIEKAIRCLFAWYPVLAIMAVCLIGPSCAGSLSGDADSELEGGKRQSLVKENRTLKKALAESEARCKELENRVGEQEAEKEKLEEQIARLNLLLVEKEAQIQESQDRRESSQKKLDEAIQEVVRAKAKLRSLESRAEAASNMAETEIALKILKSQQPDPEDDPDLVQAEQLLKMSAKEFKKENYGGALYLTNQAKGRIRIAQMRIVDQDQVAPVPGEVLFALPLPLKVIKTSNIREGPGLEFKVVTTVKPNTQLIGYSYKESWVRVRGENNLSGWIFQTLVSGR